MGRTSTSAPCALLFADPLFSRLQQSHSQSVQWLQRAFLPHTEFYRNHISAGRHRGLRRENEKTSLKRLLYETVVVWLLGGLGKGLLWKTKQKKNTVSRCVWQRRKKTLILTEAAESAVSVPETAVGHAIWSTVSFYSLSNPSLSRSDSDYDQILLVMCWHQGIPRWVSHTNVTLRQHI